MQRLDQMNASELPNHIIYVQYLEVKSFRSTDMFHLTRTQKGFYSSKKKKKEYLIEKYMLCILSFLILAYWLIGKGFCVSYLLPFVEFSGLRDPNQVSVNPTVREPKESCKRLMDHESV